MKKTPLKRGTKTLKRSGFKKGSTFNTQKSTLGLLGGNKTILRAVRPKKKSAKSKLPPKGYKVPDWFRSIPLGSHGNTPTQKRYWKVISDFVRQRDFKKYHGRCVSCGKRLERWEDGQGAHYRRYATCNSYFKFHPDNVALSCAYCNQNEDGVIGHSFGEELKRRYGEGHLDWIEKENNKWRCVKLENHIIVERVEKLLADNPWFIVP